MPDTKDYILCESIYMISCKRHNYSEGKQISGWPVAKLVGDQGTWENFRGMETFYISFVVVVTELYAFVKTHWRLHQNGWILLPTNHTTIKRIFYNCNPLTNHYGKALWIPPSTDWLLIPLLLLPGKPWVLRLCTCTANSWSQTHWGPPHRLWRPRSLHSFLLFSALPHNFQPLQLPQILHFKLHTSAASSAQMTVLACLDSSSCSQK